MADPKPPKRPTRKMPPKEKRRGTSPLVAPDPPLPPPPIPTPFPCDLCQICAQGTRLGFVMCDGGRVFIANDYPETGGPWAPSIDPVTKKVVWYNTGGT